MTDDLIPTLAEFIANTILKQPARRILPAEKLLSTGLVDSFSLVDLALFIEESFGVVIDNTELNADTFDTLEQLGELIQSRR